MKDLSVQDVLFLRGKLYILRLATLTYIAAPHQVVSNLTTNPNKEVS